MVLETIVERNFDIISCEINLMISGTRKERREFRKKAGQYLLESGFILDPELKNLFRKDYINLKGDISVSIGPGRFTNEKGNKFSTVAISISDSSDIISQYGVSDPRYRMLAEELKNLAYQSS